MQSMSIRCCSATLFSLFTFRWRAVNIFLFCSKCTPHFLFSSNSAPLAAPLVRPGADLFASDGIEKYSNSSRSTMIACLDNRGF